MGSRFRITATRPTASFVAGRAGTLAGTPLWPHPRPRFVGFSPYVAITTSSKRKPAGETDFEHTLENGYSCNAFGLPTFNQCGALNPPASVNFVIGIADGGSDVDLVAGSNADLLGLSGGYLTDNVIPIGGVGGELLAQITQPVGLYGAGLRAVNNGVLNLASLVGHANTCPVVSPPIECDTGESVTAFIGMPFLAFYNTVIRVDTPVSVLWNGTRFAGPEVTLQEKSDPLPQFAHRIAIEFGGLAPATTASYFAGLDPEDFDTPVTPTLMALFTGTFPTGGLFFVNVGLLQGVPGPVNPLQFSRMLIDTGAQATIISQAVAANLNLPIVPDFFVDICGAGGTTEAGGYYLDYVRLNAFGGAMEFSRVPVVVADLPSPEGGLLDGIFGMNMFWNRNVIFQPELTQSAFFHASSPIPVAFCDQDVDFDVDHSDVAYFTLCMTGPGGLSTPECAHLDTDGDLDIDAVDTARAVACFSGADQTANPSCGD